MLAAQLKTLKKAVPKGVPVTAISSLNREGVPDLLRLVHKRAVAARRQSDKKAKKILPVIGLKEDDSWSIRKEDDVFVVTGQKIERFARRTHFGDYYGEQRLYDILRKEGVIRGLERQGIEAGQTIRIGDPAIGELEY